MGAQYQDLGTKIYGEPERRNLLVCRGHEGLQGLEAPQEEQKVWGAAAPSKNNFMDPEPGFWDQDLVFFVQQI